MTNLTILFNKILSSNIHKPILGHKNMNKSWTWKSRKELKINVLNCIEVLKYNNINQSDRVMYKGNNSFEWVSWNIATNALGAIWVPLYNDQSDEYVNHIINDCNPKLFINDNEFKNVRCINNSVLLDDFNNDSKQDIPFCNNPDIAKLIYTSGTTGKPKGVMLTHENIISNYDAIDRRFPDFKEQDLTTLNILPWAHIYGLTTELYYNILNGNKIAISSNKENFVSELREIRPDIIYLVPRILELIKSKFNGIEKSYLKYFLPTMLKYIFGSNLITIFSGGAKLNDNLISFYNDNNIQICQGYGCTETSPMISVNGLDNTNRDIYSIGKIMDNFIVKIIDDEICVSSPSVMKGYWNNKEATNEVLHKEQNNIFYKTGDTGYIKDDFLFYNGRMSENYKLNNGKFVSLSTIEDVVKTYINIPVIVYGDNKPYNILITEKDNIIDQLFIDKINSKLDNYLHIKKVLYIESETFSKYMTPKLSLKRKLLFKDIEEVINDIYR